MKLAFFEIQGWEKPQLRKQLKNHELLFFKEPLTLKNVEAVKNCDGISVFIYSTVNAKVLKQLPKLKLVTTRSTGFDHIDKGACKKRKIPIFTVPFYGENTVAEHTFALILSLSRNITKSYVRTLRNDFSIEGLKGFDLKGKTLGIIGGGHIGLHVVRMAKAFGMCVLVYDPIQNPFMAEVLGFRYVPLEELLRHSDVISLHAPYMPATHHLINKKNIKLIKKGAILINTARGGLVETEALIEALDKKIIAGAGLDVMEGEELIREEKQLLYDSTKAEALSQLVKSHILLSRDNVVFTPHIAFYSQEALERILQTTVENIQGFLSGQLKNNVA